jgi:hypothetical protein
MTGTSEPAHPSGERAPGPVVVRSARRRRVLSFGVWCVSMLAAALILVNAGDADLQTSLGNLATLLFVLVGAILVGRLRPTASAGSSGLPASSSRHSSVHEVSPSMD